MKYAKLLKQIQLEDYKNAYINYALLKKHITSMNFFGVIQNEINNFDNHYCKLKQDTHLNFIDLYTFLLVNYLSIHKILKKLRKKNYECYSKIISQCGNIENLLSCYSFYSDITNIPEHFKQPTENICPICLDHCKFPITTKCNHTFCWDCLHKLNHNFDFCPCCREETTIDPILIILNTILPCDKKYSPLTLTPQKTSIGFDVVSDLHIDQWSTKYKDTNIYPSGEIVHHPMTFGNTASEYLIVAGDISDDINESIRYLNEVSKYYKKILFVDGNHEHVYKYPKLYSKKHISSCVTNDKLVYLPSTPFRIHNTLFVGCCGWWNYNNESIESIQQCLEYFDSWIQHFTKKDNLDFINNVIKKSKEEYNELKDALEKYDKDDTIESIVIVTHTIPDIQYSGNKNFDIDACQYNTKFKNLLKYSKVSKWIFGHTHKHWNVSKDGIQFICNPRGRPNDFNRKEYDVAKINI